MSQDGLVTTQGHILRAQLLAGVPGALGLSWYAVGDANDSWDATPPAESIDSVGLIRETARKRINRFAYLVQAIDGAHLFNGVRYAETTTPSPILAFFTDFQESEASGFSIREEALFGGTVVTAAQPYALPGQVSVPGICYWTRNRGIYVKSGRDTFSGIVILQEG